MRNVMVIAALFTALMCRAGDYSVVVGQKAPNKDGDNTVFEDFINKRSSTESISDFRIIPHFKGDMPTEMQAAIEAACDVWESLIVAPNAIEINFVYSDSLSQGNIIESRLEYDIVNNTVYPYTLISAYGKDYVSLLKGDSDGEIKINDEVVWDCSLDESISDNPNLCYYTLRALAQTFGFSTSLCEKSLRGRSFLGFFIVSRYSPYDNMVFDYTGKRLSSIVTSGSRESAELNAFVCPASGTNLYLLKQDDAYRLYAPTPFIFGQSLALLDNPASLMHYNPGVGSKRFAVDNVTFDVLRAIGWQFEPSVSDSPITINPMATNPDGIFCAYQPHGFAALIQDGANAENISWVYELPDAAGEYHTIKSSADDSAFEIPALSSVSQYKRNAEGYVEGHLRLTAMVNGRNESAEYDVLLSLAPKILSAHVTDVTYTADGRGYSVTITINHVGSDYLRIYLEEEYNGAFRSKMVNQPNTAVVTFDNVSPYVYIWFDINAYNDYGSDAYTIELDDEYILNHVH